MPCPEFSLVLRTSKYWADGMIWKSTWMPVCSSNFPARTCSDDLIQSWLAITSMVTFDLVGAALGLAVAAAVEGAAAEGAAEVGALEPEEEEHPPTSAPTRKMTPAALRVLFTEHCRLSVSGRRPAHRPARDVGGLNCSNRPPQTPPGARVGLCRNHCRYHYRHAAV